METPVPDLESKNLHGSSHLTELVERGETVRRLTEEGFRSERGGVEEAARRLTEQACRPERGGIEETARRLAEQACRPECGGVEEAARRLTEQACRPELFRAAINLSVASMSRRINSANGS